jgi:O-antigen ligase
MSYAALMAEVRNLGVWNTRTSSVPYLTVLAVGIVIARFAGYLWFEQPILKGQSANIVLLFIFFAFALILWLRLERRAWATGWFRVFLILMSLAWVVTLIVFRYHGDSFNYTAFLYVPILGMIAFKPPRAEETWTAITAYAWAVSFVLISTRIFEMLGLLMVKQQAIGVIKFDEERYFLPVNDLLGIDGRWPGPFGHNGDTAMMGALLIVIAFAHWTRGSWLFLFVGAFTLLITYGRASIGAALVGIILILMFTNNSVVSRVNRPLRFVIGLVALGIGAFVVFSGAAGLTGRNSFWPAFLDLWRSEPWFGVGGSGIAVSGGITQEFGHAHSLYIDLLARYGVILFVLQMLALAVGVGIALYAARLGQPGALAILTAFLVTGITEPRNDWMHPSVTGMLVILAVTAAARARSEPERNANSVFPERNKYLYS